MKLYRLNPKGVRMTLQPLPPSVSSGGAEEPVSFLENLIPTVLFTYLNGSNSSIAVSETSDFEI